MFDFSFGEIAVIGAVALVVLGPERLPKVARTAGEWMGKAQRYVSQVKSDINREMELAELKKLQEEARNAAQSVQSGFTDLQSDLNRTADNLNSSLTTPIAGDFARVTNVRSRSRSDENARIPHACADSHRRGVAPHADWSCVER